MKIRKLMISGKQYPYIQITEEGHVVYQRYCRGLGKQQHQIQRVIVGICVDEKSIKSSSGLLLS